VILSLLVPTNEQYTIKLSSTPRLRAVLILQSEKNQNMSKISWSHRDFEHWSAITWPVN